MTNESTGGVSKRSLVLLGAFAALALNKDLRRSFVQGTRDAIDGAQTTLDDTVKPALSSAAQSAQQAAVEAAHQAGETWGHLREEGPSKAQALLSTAQDAVGTLAATAADRAAQLQKDAAQAAEQARKQYEKEYAPKLGELQDNLKDAADERRAQAQQALKDARKQYEKEYAPKLDALQSGLSDAADEHRHQAEKALKQARRKGMVALADLGDKASTLRDQAGDALDDHRKDAEHALARARRDAEKELRKQRKNWNPKKLESAVEKRMGPVHKQVQRELSRLEKEAGKGGRRLEATLKPEPKSGGLGTLGTVLLVGAGVAVLARVPSVRRSVLSAVEGVSPDAAQKLHHFSRQARNIVGGVWLETLEEKPSAAPAAAPSTQGATTGATAGATVAPDAPAADKTPAAPAEDKKSDGKDGKDAASKAN